MQKSSLENTLAQIHTLPLSVVYFTSPSCGVCGVMKPKVAALTARFNVPTFDLEVADYPEVASLFHIMVSPALIVFSQGKELQRQAKFIKLDELEALLAQAVVLLD